MSPLDYSTDQKLGIAKIIEKISEVSTLPRILQLIIAATADPNAGALHLQNILKADPALTAKILKAANSAYYGVSQKILNVKLAVMFLGFKAVKNLAIAASVCDMFRSGRQINNYSREALWQHSMAVAICAKSIAQRSGLQTGEDIFTVGIMHDIGIIMEDQYLHEDFTGMLNDPRCAECGITEVEHAVFGFDHAQLGARVMDRWKMPEEIYRPIEYHHRPQRAPDAWRMLTAIVYLADVICNATKTGFVLGARVIPADMAFALDVLHFTREDVSIIVEELSHEIEQARDLLVF